MKNLRKRLSPVTYALKTTQIKRLTAAFLLTALLLPILFIGNFAPVAASSSSSAPKAPVIASTPLAASGDSASASLTTALSSIISINQSLTSGYLFAADAVNPQPPDGLALAKMPTISERVAASALSAYSSVSSVIAPLFVVPANNSSVSTANVEPLLPVLPQPPHINKFDFDSDGKPDAARWQPSTGEWRYKKSSDGTTVSLSLGTATTAAPADYDGDNKTDPAVFTDWAGSWKVKYSSSGQEQTISTFGISGDKVVSGDYDGDNKADLAVWRPSTGVWYVRKSNSNFQVVSTSWGQSGDVPVPGDYDGDGLLDYAIFRPSSGTWYILPGSGGSYFSLQWGLGSDTPVPADYDGDGKTDCAIYRPSTGSWYAYKSSTNNGAFMSKIWGNYGDQPVPADYDNDGLADFAVWRPTTGVWYIANSGYPTVPNTPEYSYNQLGMTGDVAVPSAYLKQIGGQVLAYNLANARLSPKNATKGTDLYSRNFGWGTGLVSLPGRAGLDAGFGISYNSLVWTKEPTSNTMVFDADNSNVSPGFRFGFPTVEAPYYNGLTQKFSYMMVTPSGSRVEFRQDAASGLYEAEDSSYAQLTVTAPPPVSGQTTTAEQLTLVVRRTDGTHMNYSWKAGAYRLNQIKDRNGNFITVVYDDQYGLLRTITDTLGRVININYDAEFYPTSITQVWKANNGESGTVTHTYATFTYGYQIMDPKFAANLSVFGPSGEMNIKVLSYITYADGSVTAFDYNKYGQVGKVRNIAPDSHLLSSTRTNLESAVAAEPVGGYTDCPRFSETRNYVENFNNNQETVIHNTLTSNETFIAGGATVGPADMVEVSMDNAPYSPLSQTYYYGAGNWQEGLPFGTIDIADGVQKRWTRSVWTQDTSTLYKVNPRVIESKVGDEINTKRTTIEYYPAAQNSSVALYGLVKEVKVYDTDQTTVLKRSTTEYNLAQTFLDRRIIGLPAESELFDQNDALMSKATFDYDTDQDNFGGTEQTIAPTQHDNTNYGAGFVTGRGNLTKTTRCDVAQSTDLTCGGGIVSKVKYNTAGAPVSQITPGSSSTGTTREVKISYADKFIDDPNNSLSRNTFAYPTKITDPASNFSEVRYRFDIGANVWAMSPAPAGNQTGKETTRIFDSVGRLEKETLVNNGAYTRYQYFDNQVQSKTFTTVTSGLGETVSETFTNGAGAVRATRTELPNSLGWSGVKTEYDILGRVKRQTAPTEVDSDWSTATGDDDRGVDGSNNPVYLWQSQEYDWKGRVTRIVNTDGTDKLISYEGCGCAGGQVTTVKGEEIIETDWQGNNPNSLGRRTQKMYADIQGRTYKTQVMNWNGTAPYTTIMTQFDGRDQAVNIKQYDGAETSSTVQETTMTYDGFGRLKTEHRPEQDANTVTTYNYNADDSISSVVDARGASTNYTYNTRGLVTQMSYSVPTNSPIPVTPTVNFIYDNIGNRTQMADGLGTINYAYNDLSQMTSETRLFTDNLVNAPLDNSVQAFKLTYEYTLSGQLKSLKDPYGQQINYTHDKTGRLLSVTGATAFAGVTDYASNAEYRAWGALKGLHTGNGLNAVTTFNNRLRPASFQLERADQSSVMSKTYEYYADASLRKLDDLLEDKFDRMNKYDQTGAIKESKAGTLAHGGPVGTYQERPYTQTYNYNPFGQLTGRSGAFWNSNYSYSHSIENNRITGYVTNGVSNPSKVFQYDADGRPLNAYTDNFRRGDQEYDAAGDLTKISDYSGETVISEIRRHYDGEGRESSRNHKTLNTQTSTWTEKPEGYYIASTVLNGEVITEADATGRQVETNIFAAGRHLARQIITYDTSVGTQYQVEWKNQDSFALSDLRTSKYGQTSVVTGDDYAPLELDPMGSELWSQFPSGGPYDPVLPVQQNQDEDDWQTGNNANYYNRGGGGAASPPCAIGSILIDCSRIRFADGLENNIFGALERAKRQSATQTGTRTRVRELVDKHSLGKPSSGQQYGSGQFNESYLVGYEWWTEPIYGNNFSVSAFSKKQQNKMNVDPPGDKNPFQQTLNLINLFINRVKVVGFNDKQRDTIIQGLLYMMFSQPCVDAFKAAGLPTPAEQIRDRGLIIAHFDILSSSSNNTLLGISDGERAYIYREKNDIRIGGFTPDINQKPGPIITFFYNWSFNGTTYPFDENAVHERIHGSGVKTDRSFRVPFIAGSGLPSGTVITPIPNIFSHDLSGFPQYTSIIENCRYNPK